MKFGRIALLVAAGAAVVATACQDEARTTAPLTHATTPSRTVVGGAPGNGIGVVFQGAGTSETAPTIVQDLAAAHVGWLRAPADLGANTESEVDSAVAQAHRWGHYSSSDTMAVLAGFNESLPPGITPVVSGSCNLVSSGSMDQFAGIVDSIIRLQYNEGVRYFSVGNEPDVHCSDPNWLQYYVAELVRAAHVIHSFPGAQVVGFEVSPAYTTTADLTAIDQVLKTFVAGGVDTVVDVLALHAYSSAQSILAMVNDTARTVITSPDVRELWLTEFNGASKTWTALQDRDVLAGVLQRFMRPNEWSNNPMWTKAFFFSAVSTDQGHLFDGWTSNSTIQPTVEYYALKYFARQNDAAYTERPMTASAYLWDSTDTYNPSLWKSADDTAHFGVSGGDTKIYGVGFTLNPTLVAAGMGICYEVSQAWILPHWSSQYCNGQQVMPVIYNAAEQPHHIQTIRAWLTNPMPGDSTSQMQICIRTSFYGHGWQNWFHPRGCNGSVAIDTLAVSTDTVPGINPAYTPLEAMTLYLHGAIH